MIDFYTGTASLCGMTEFTLNVPYLSRGDAYGWRVIDEIVDPVRVFVLDASAYTWFWRQTSPRGLEVMVQATKDTDPLSIRLWVEVR